LKSKAGLTWVKKTTKLYLNLFIKLKYKFNKIKKSIYVNSIEIDDIKFKKIFELISKHDTLIENKLGQVLLHLQEKHKDYYFYDFSTSVDLVVERWKDEKYNILINFFKKNNLANKFFLVDNNQGTPFFDSPNHLGIAYFIGFTGENTYKISDRKFTKHFVCMNRTERLHRQIIFDFLNSELSDKTYLSYTPNEIDNPRRKVLDKIKKGDVIFYDEKIVYATPFQKTSFCNIVTESDYRSGPIHITEKTDKCFSAGQPFILVAGSGYLKKIKEYGFKTFGKWWDESYDDEINFYKRIDKIKNLILEISKWSIEECENKYKEMEDVLLHNQSLCISFFKNGHFPPNIISVEEVIGKKNIF